MATLDDVRSLLDFTLQLGGRSLRMDPTSPLLGSLPELDSIAVVSLITTLEEHFGIAVADDEISADTFATLGSLSAFVDRKLSE
jgi:acyl carrier protein